MIDITRGSRVASMALLIGVTAAGSAVGAAVVLSDDGDLPRSPGAEASGLRTVMCAARVEPAARPRSGDITAGPLAFKGARELSRLSSAQFRPRRGRYRAIKAGVVLRAGRRAAVSVAPGDRDRVGLVYGGTGKSSYALRETERALGFHSCRAGQRSFTRRGRVGPYTGWAGGFIVTSPGCATVLVQSSESRYEAVIPFGVPSCP